MFGTLEFGAGDGRGGHSQTKRGETYRPREGTAFSSRSAEITLGHKHRESYVGRDRGGESFVPPPHQPWHHSIGEVISLGGSIDSVLQSFIVVRFRVHKWDAKR